MGAADSRSRSVSYGLDEQDNVTVIHGVKLSGDVLQRMRESGPSSSSSSSSLKAESTKPEPGPSRPSSTETRRSSEDGSSASRLWSRKSWPGSAVEREISGDDIKTRQEVDKTHNLCERTGKQCVIVLQSFRWAERRSFCNVSSSRCCFFSRCFLSG
ncbi:MICOS complex subunit mic25a-like [Puntigrus tetrazona]|uniref:MICOS complex subunit mic25a-like n=1 Tax=Puntigrus tetrazona TaxID=1606681 RepID=UPI001C8B0353|nr:MICOS complex subunit mic25a-like [Puntigrus tetrazona]